MATPPPLAFPCFRVVHHNALVEVAVSDIDLVRRLVKLNACGPAKHAGVLIVLRCGRGMTDLHQEAPIVGELEDLPVILAVTAQPDIACAVDPDTVFVARPVLCRCGASPGL